MQANYSYPKILIFSQTFNNFSGGGITLINLFSGWPKERLAVVTYNFMLSGVSTEICDTYYQLGQEEIHWKFPFCLFKPKFKSGLIKGANPSTNPQSLNKRKTRQRWPVYSLNLLIKWLGLDHLLSSISISKCLNSWLLQYKPELLYFQISNRESINFAVNLIQYLYVPSVIHMMDDWPSTIAEEGICKKIWTKKIDKEFRQLLDKIDLHLSICDEMSAEYEKRYGHQFYSFHNTLDVDRWTPYIKKDLNLNKGTKIILFSGRIGKGIEQSLFELAAGVDVLRFEGLDIRLNIQSPRSDPEILDQLRQYESVTINAPIEYDRIPELYSNADILVIANDFSCDGIRFLKYSMPTKAPEYMISGTPILVYASSETVLYKMFHINLCGHCVSKQGPIEIADALRLLFKDISYRQTLSRNAVAYALENFDSKKIRLRFQSLLRKTAGGNLT